MGLTFHLARASHLLRAQRCRPPAVGGRPSHGSIRPLHHRPGRPSALFSSVPVDGAVLSNQSNNPINRPHVLTRWRPGNPTVGCGRRWLRDVRRRSAAAGYPFFLDAPPAAAYKGGARRRGRCSRTRCSHHLRSCSPSSLPRHRRKLLLGTVILLSPFRRPPHPTSPLDSIAVVAPFTAPPYCSRASHSLGFLPHRRSP